MKKLFVLFFVTVMILSGCGSKEGGVVLQKETPEYELAKALSEKLEYLDPDKNNILVSSKDFDLTVGDIMTDLMAGMGNRSDGLKSMTPERLKTYMDNIATRFGEQRLLLKEAKDAGVSSTDAEIDSVMNMQFERAGGQEKFASMIERSGLTMDFVRKDIAKNLNINLYLEKMMNDNMEIPEEDLRKIYDEDKTATVQHILLMTQGKPLEEKEKIRKKMEDILEEAKSGKDFAKLANKYSEDPGSNKKGGLYEDFGRGAMVKPFEEAAFNVPVGEISDIVETRYGFHILKVVERKKETRPFEEVRSEIEEKTKQSKRSEIVPKHIEELKTAAEFKIVEFE